MLSVSSIIVLRPFGRVTSLDGDARGETDVAGGRAEFYPELARFERPFPAGGGPVGQIPRGEREPNVARPARLQVDPGETRQLAWRACHPGCRATHIELGDLVARSVARIRHDASHRQAVAILPDPQIPVLEPGIGQAVPEGVGNWPC